jgi:hypothetical protein
MPANRIYPNFLDIFPQEPDRFEDSTDLFYLESLDGLSQHEQILEIRNVPEGAYNCQVHLVLETQAEPVITGLQETQVIRIDNLPTMTHDGIVTWNNVSQFFPALQHVGTFDLEGLDQPGRGSGSIAQVDVACAAEYNFWFSYGQVCDDKSISLRQGAVNGIYLHYDL